MIQIDKRTTFKPLRIRTRIVFQSIIVSSFLLLGTGCSKYVSILSFSKTEQLPVDPWLSDNYRSLIIRPFDILAISVSSLEAEAVEFLQTSSSQGYLVNAQGKVDFPLLGEVHVQGKTTIEAKYIFLKLLKKYFVQPPSVSVSIINFKINVIGEVNSPGVYQIPNERINLIEAITLAGDFTSYSRRDSVVIIRENGMEKSFVSVNFDYLEVMNSPHFYLQQNDIVYILPSKKKLATIRNREDKLLPYISIATGLIFLITAVFNLR